MSQSTFAPSSVAQQSDTVAASKSPSRSSGKRWLRYSLWVGGGAAGLTALIGMLHMPFASALLRKISPASVCPVMRGSPAQIDRAHELGAANIRATATSFAPTRPALGFTLDGSTKVDLDRWAKEHDIHCKSIAGNETLQRCTNVPPAAIGAPSEFGTIEEITFEFRSTGQLVNVQTLRRGLNATQAASLSGSLEQNTAQVVGAPSTIAGSPTVAHLSHGLMSTFVAEHTFKDYRATITATNLASTGYMVREEYLSTR